MMRPIQCVVPVSTVVVMLLYAVASIPPSLSGAPGHRVAYAQAQSPADATPSPTPAGTPMPSAYRVCDYILSRVPSMVILSVLANPSHLYGTNMLCYPNLPPGPFNGPRTWLGLRDAGRPWNPLFNHLAWKCGCG